MYRLRDNGFTAFLVGGSVRDLLIGRTPKDFDIATDATPAEIKRVFRNCRLVGRRFRLAHIHFKDEVIEVATFRKGGDLAEPDPEESDPVEDDSGETPPEEPRRDLGHLHKSDEGVLLRDNLFGTPEEDAWRRDFTVNALSYNIADFSIIDYVGGVEDLDKRLIRTIGDPSARFAEDPVRMLRAIRFAAQLDFTIEHHSWEAMSANARRITLASPARLFDEVVKLFLSGAAEKCWQLLCASGLAAAIFPDFIEWLSAQETDPSLKAVAWIDSTLLNGGAVSNPLLLALFFGEYLSASGGKGMPVQAGIDRSLAGFMAEVAGRVFIPQRAVMRFREILLLQQRLLKMPGRKPENVITRPAFAETIDYVRFCAGGNAALAKTVSWWDRLAAAKGVTPPATDQGTEGREVRPRGRRRRRGRKKPKVLLP
ncbi:MAG: pcnB [Deltaproteobacteria bacterium]|nr:pcnB [Deltaproteobacteria bacterium]